VNLEITIDDKAIRAALARVGGTALNKIIRPSLERRANDARKEAVKAFVSRGIGRGIFGRNDSGAWKMIRLSPVVESGSNLSLKLSAVGFAALQETGGRIKPHRIQARKGGVLAFVTGGTLAFAKFVNHPGASVPKYPALQPAAEKIPAAVIADIQPLIAALWEKAA
jgi:hypothetical protein